MHTHTHWIKSIDDEVDARPGRIMFAKILAQILYSVFQKLSVGIQDLIVLLSLLYGIRVGVLW